VNGKASASFLKKRSKKLFGAVARCSAARVKGQKFFGSRRAGAAFFQKRTCSFACLSCDLTPLDSVV
jgi:hypothetical protein